MSPPFRPVNEKAYAVMRVTWARARLGSVVTPARSARIRLRSIMETSPGGTIANLPAGRDTWPARVGFTCRTPERDRNRIGRSRGHADMLPNTDNLAAVVQAWLKQFEQTLRDEAALQRLFTADGYWRDVLAF